MTTHSQLTSGLGTGESAPRIPPRGLPPRRLPVERPHEILFPAQRLSLPASVLPVPAHNVPVPRMNDLNGLLMIGERDLYDPCFGIHRCR